MNVPSPESLRGLTAADVMLATPKTLPAGTTVEEARRALANEHVQMLLLTDGALFRGAVTSIPEDADPAAPALGYSDEAAPAVGPAEPADAVFERTRVDPHRRTIVLGGDGTLLGLVCLNASLTHFCSGRG